MSAENNPRFLNLEAAAMDAAGRGIQAMLILNGGAAVASFGLLGSLAGSANLRPEFFPLLSSICIGLVCFAIGSASAAIGWFVAYYTNQNYANAMLHNFDLVRDNTWKKGQRLNKYGFWVLVTSFVFFIGGVVALALNIPSFSQLTNTSFDCGLCLTYA